MWLDSLLLTDTVADEASQMVSVVTTMCDTLYTHMLKKRESKEKDDEEAIAKLEQEVEMMEAEDEDTADKTTNKPKMQNAKISSRKPIWNLLPMQQQVIAPWIMCELMQLMVKVWHVLYEAEPNYATFNKYARVLCSVASHIHESKSIIQAAQEKDLKTVRFVTPPCMLNVKLMRQLVEVSSRFVSNLPDLKDHLAVVESSKKKSSACPTELSRNWERRQRYMRELMDQEETNVSTRYNVHKLLSLAECGV
ncbi:uncharacterized protein LOC124193140 [Daphnia pulex]|uniref:uncharacterized protein LOC124193140 n=1 Tax=Daphnia pulex TaxID=6669 RepID=UPI001EDE635A|nr:uncharacterized protein LOC124193140 [Daphnia pulex]XP_046442766.1 uncharacterized protein LOC124193140 [Daphnia pulex]